jgi:hypothetical protein
MEFLRSLLELDELNCLRCGEDLKTRADFETGICADCWDPKVDGEYEGSDDLWPDREEECEYMEVFVDPATNEILSEAAVRQFKLKNKKIKRMYRCTSGPKKGRPVSDPKQCMQRKDPAKVRQGKKNMRRGKAVRKRKAKITRKSAISRNARRLNKSLKGNSSGSVSTLDKTLPASSTKFTKASGPKSSKVKNTESPDTKKTKKPTKTKKTK